MIRSFIVTPGVRLVTALGVILLLAGPVTTHAQGSRSVVILVVDDFTSDEVAADDFTDATAADSCAVNVESQAFAVRGVSAEPVEVTHGELVYGELEELLEDASAESAITLVQVDIHGLTTEAVAEQVADAIDENEADFYVINMSFAIIPCEYVDAFAQYSTQLMDAREAKNLNSYRGLFQRAVVFYDSTVFPVMSHRAQQAQDLDPLQEVLADLSANAVAVASAGNFGLDFPFWPGAWGQVVSVSGSTGEGYYAPDAWNSRTDTPLLTAETVSAGRQTRISNYGEVMMPGEYTADEGVLSGTSFAAPRLSMAVALYLSEVGSAFCRNDDGFFALASGQWDNLGLDEAAADNCPAMVAYLP
jgi:hypothetical protein